MTPTRDRRKSHGKRWDLLAELNHHAHLDAAKDCPEVLKDLFMLINRTRIGIDDLTPQVDGRPFNASHVYDTQLIKRALGLTRECSSPGMNKKSEFQWQSALSPHVFLSLDNGREELTTSERPYHHCLACCRVFRPGSRPLLNPTLDFGDLSDTKATSEAITRDQLCKNVRHINLPNFVLQPQLRYNYEGGHGVPDATIGLCSYNLRKEPWQRQRPDLRTNRRIRRFTLTNLKKFFNDETLKEPYPKQVLDDGVPLFAFAIWEAKKSGGNSHWSAFTQLDKKVRSLLDWQDSMINEVENDGIFIPTVWAFTSVGSSWTVYGCYQSRGDVNEDDIQSSVRLWSGDVCEKNEALQLLWIIDIIKFWAEYTYKPMIGACLALKTHMDKQNNLPKENQAELSLEDTLWKIHITLNEENTPWFFHPANSPHKNSSRQKDSSPRSNRPNFNVKSLSEQCSTWSSEPIPKQVLHRRPTLNEQQMDDFTWLLDMDPYYGGNLLVIRLRREGKLDEPLILVEPQKNSDDRTQTQYSGKVPSRRGADAGLGREYRGINLLQEYRNFFSAKYQFCAILPLESEDYEEQRRKSNRASIFEPLEDLLDLESLYFKIAIECMSHPDCRNAQKKMRLNEESDDDDDSGSHEGSDDKDESGSREESDEDYEDESDDSDESNSVEEALGDEVDENSDYDESCDNVEDAEQAETDTSKFHCEHYIEHVHKAWDRHNWPSEKQQILAFARIALKLDSTKIKAYKNHDRKMYSEARELPINCMTPVRNFGKSFSLIEGRAKLSHPVSKTVDTRSNETEQRLVDIVDKGKKDVSKLGEKFKSLGVR